MSKIQYKNKLVAVLNKTIEPGKVTNALAHMCIGLGAILGKDELRLLNYKDQDGSSHPFISEMPFIILRENSNKIRKLRNDAITHNITFADFTDTMTIGTYQDQLIKTAETKEENLVYYGIVLYGDWEIVSQLTSKFSLWR